MTWRGFVWLGLWILSVVGISFYGGIISYSFFIALTMLPVLSLLYMLAVALGFKIYQEMDNSDVVCDKMNDYFFMLQNDMPFSFAGLKVILFPDFFEVLDVPQDTEYELLPGEQYCFRTKIFCKYRGEYEVGVKSVVISDFLHIFRWNYNLISTYKVTVRPKIVLVDKLKCMDEISARQTRENQYGKNLPDVVTRDYVRGDSIRMIHWKATAKTGDLKVRNYYDESKQCIRIYFELKRYSKDNKIFLPLENKILETVISLAAFFAYQHLPINITCGEDDNRNFQVSDHKNFEVFYDSVSSVVFDTDEDVSQKRTLFFQRDMSEPAQIVFMVLHEITQDILDGTQDMVNKGDYVVIYLVTDEGMEEYFAYSNERRQIIRIATTDELDITL